MRSVVKKYYIYGHYTADTNELFYVGKGHGRRCGQLSSKRRNKFWQNVVNKHGVRVEILIENLTEEEAFQLEMVLIKQYGRRDLGTGPLVNLTNGGEGPSGIIREGRKLTTTERKHLSELLTGKPKPPRSIEHCKKLRESKLGKKRGSFTEEHRLKISLSNKGKIFTEEHKQKLSTAKKGKRRKPFSEETKRKISIARKKYEQRKNEGTS